jgi:aryl-alcohol dehydrogenase-like predicted oxidoreductase
MKLALGTAQFGLAYGIANAGGQVDLETAKLIVRRAWETGIDTIDTAIAYGQSERRLGEAGVQAWRIVSKLPAIPEGCADVSAWVNSNVDKSLAQLKVTSLAGLLLHRPQQLLGPHGKALYHSLLQLKEEKKVEKIGVSIYSPEELDDIWPLHQFDLVQSPLNVFDRRLAVSGWLQRLHADGVEVHVRSAFLQGLLLSPRDRLPSGFGRWSSLWASWYSWLESVNMTPLQAALGHVLSFPQVDRIVVGVDNLQQLNEILKHASGGGMLAPAALTTDDLDLINPAQWSTFL